MTGQVIAYARVSSYDQSLDVQTEHLLAAGAVKVFAEKRSGKSTNGRTELEAAINYAREGDLFLVTRLDRVARSITDLHSIVDRLRRKGVEFRALQQGEIDTTTSYGKLMLSILGAFAEFELDIRKERQREGIERAKAEGKYKRAPSLSETQVAKATKMRVEEKLGASAIAKRFEVSARTIYRALPGLFGESIRTQPREKVW